MMLMGQIWTATRPWSSSPAASVVSLLTKAVSSSVSMSFWRSSQTTVEPSWLISRKR